MIHLPNLIADLGLLLGAAAVITLIFKYLKQPVVLGYLIAGFLVGPHFKLFPTIVEQDNVQVWAEIGVVFLLFSLGLEFSFKKLMKVGGSASISAMSEIVIMLAIGYFTGQMFGWSKMDSIFLGAILSVSSTTIIIRAFEEVGVKGQKFASLVFGVLIVEDLATIVLLVILSTLAVSQHFAGAEMMFSVMKLVFFLTLWFIGGIFFIPTLLKRIKPMLSDEMLLIISLSLCLLMVYLASEAGFSPALGAFIMGSILAETNQGIKIEHLVTPIKDLFGAVFFVSVGMMIDPTVLQEYWAPVLIIIVITIVGKLFSSGLGALISGQPLKTSIQTGLSLAQIGEFSFIIATLGATLDVTSAFLYPITVAVSAITTFTTPYMIKLSFPLANKIVAALPKRWRENLDKYSSATQSVSATTNWQTFLKKYIINTVVYLIFSIALIILSTNYLYPFLQEQSEGAAWGIIATIAITIAGLSPFLYALGFRNLYDENAQKLLNHKIYRNIIYVMRILRYVLAVGLIIVVLNNLLSFQAAIIAFLVICVCLIIFGDQIKKNYIKIEERFLTNFKSNVEDIEIPVLAPWDAHFTEITVKPESLAVGKTLEELKWREKSGINVASISRGELNIHLPARDTVIYPGDKLYIIGTDTQIKKINSLLRPEKNVKETDNLYKPSLERIIVNKDSYLYGKSLKESDIRNYADGIVVGIERNGHRIVNPESNWVFEENDLVWIVGDHKKIITTLR
ncbi:transporter, CPA2 family [Pseudopedobacter saltans DSM 12145]|uniref:Transporter, CPA2 family n=1 Tax=Pseudopedobacter saltans (strain ATCC 51119 / DSM 12145 / JCM 21818 / CCUG 39354 / LMG 10337 / NBRC 100064 / NCIMB 13643) TaxID=762903 RepID=F0SBI1_PSESL|nr:cation:proton antiporter [Pseudopedobacter saltans]ADY51627.1 transporter, CPA2 family [Pseudopedobacter saltans DSM 12145]